MLAVSIVTIVTTCLADLSLWRLGKPRSREELLGRGARGGQAGGQPCLPGLGAVPAGHLAGCPSALCSHKAESRGSLGFLGSGGTRWGWPGCARVESVSREACWGLDTGAHTHTHQVSLGNRFLFLLRRGAWAGRREGILGLPPKGLGHHSRREAG